MKPVKLLAALVLMMAISTATDAQTTRSKVQHKRIKQGVRSGELTRHETKQLANQQQEIREDKKEAKADGVVTPGEKKEIRQEQRKASRNIYRKKHNKRDRN